ncbi:MAG: Do family serine endopeptidase [Bacteroidales bacterium]|nr:Do family serine endopeptidase [Bacteroidales bacterium]
MKGQKFIVPIISAIIGGVIAVAISNYIFKGIAEPIAAADKVEKVYFAKTFAGDSNSTDFTVAAERTVDAVVHVKTAYTMNNTYSYGDPFFDFFFGPQQYSKPQPVQSSGSGVILTRDGFIVTNNHVIDNAEEIEVVLNDKRTFKAKLVGRDPSTDIALLKIDATDLPFIQFGNSDDVKVGEWVLAIGNPFNLNSTVTAGIISAKARNIQILQGSYAIESFIQTDAAVNPGNSGGALVNLKGELVGINTAIASKTGSYAGYSFAVPSSIAKKIVTDIIEFGEVQRAILGVSISELTEEIASENGIKEIKGVYVAEVSRNGAAEKAGIQAGDVIMSINGIDVNSLSQLQEQISKYRPNQQVDVVVNRDNNKKHFTVTLTNLRNGLELITQDAILEKLGAKFTTITDKQKKELRINGGLEVTEIDDGAIKASGIKKGYIITRINRAQITDIDDLKRIIEISSGAVLVEGVYPNGSRVAYALTLE